MNREPIGITGLVVAFLTSITNAAVLLGMVVWDIEQLAAVDLVITNGAILGGVIFARSKVTPVADPRNDYGEPMEVLPHYLSDE